MSIQGEIAYNDGFIDGQEDVLDEIIDIVDTYNGSWQDAVENIRLFVENLKKRIDSL